MVVARASGTDLTSSLKRNTFLTLEVHPVGGSARDGGPEKGPRTGGQKKGPRLFLGGGPIFTEYAP